MDEDYIITSLESMRGKLVNLISTIDQEIKAIERLKEIRKVNNDGS